MVVCLIDSYLEVIFVEVVFHLLQMISTHPEAEHSLCMLTYLLLFQAPIYGRRMKRVEVGPQSVRKVRQ